MSLIHPQEVINGGILRPAPLNARFDVQLIAPHVSEAEERFALPALCQAFYDALVAEKAGTISNYNPAVGAIVPAFPGNAAYEALWTEGALMKFLALAATYEAMPFIAMQFGANGLFLNNTEFGENAGIKGVQFMQDTLLERIERKRVKLMEYLCENKAALTGFCGDYCEDCDDGAKEAQKYQGIIFY